MELHSYSPEDRPLLDRLWQLYKHDLSEFRHASIGVDGSFPTRVLDGHLGDPERRIHLLRRGETPLGFAVVSRREGAWFMADFFVLRSIRREGVGTAAARRLLTAHPGVWRIVFQEENPAAARFWRALAAARDPSATEERRPVPDKPHLPHDVWLTLVVAGG